MTVYRIGKYRDYINSMWKRNVRSIGKWHIAYLMETHPLLYTEQMCLLGSDPLSKKPVGYNSIDPPIRNSALLSLNLKIPGAFVKYNRLDYDRPAFRIY